MRAPLAVLAAVAAVAVHPAGHAAGDTAEWLLQASNAAQSANYQGVVVYRDANVMEVMRVVHRHKDGLVQERLTSLTGQPRDILREGDQVSCITPGGDVEGAGGMPQGLFPVMTAATLADAARHYTFREAGEARVAGRACRGIALSPRDEFRYGYEMCADTATAVPLRVTLLDAQGRTIEELMFTEVSFPAEITDAVFEAPPGVSPQTPDDIVEVSAPPPWRLARVPPGFRVILRSHHPGPSGDLVEHVLLSDGLSAVSVFGARPRVLDLEPGPGGLARMGAMNAYSRVVGTYHVTVVGEVPESTVRLIGDGLRLEEAAAGTP